MVQLSVIEARLTKLGVKKTFFCRPEIRELPRILMDGESIMKCVQGRYTGGFALLVATDQRLLLIDKKPLYLTVEDIRYDMISEIDMNARLFNATICLFTINKQLSFSSARQTHLRELAAYVQKRVMELRQYHQETPPPAVQLAQPMPADSRQGGFSYHPNEGVQTVTHQIAQHMPHMHMPNPVSGVIARTRDHIPAHMPQAVGSAATKLASRLHNPNPYTKAPLIMRRQWSSWTDTD